MTTAVYAIANVQHALQALKEKIPAHQWSDTPLPVIAAPSWWLEEARQELGVAAGHEVAEIHGCTVTRMDTISEPLLVDHDGKVYPILPAWLRAKQAADGVESEGGEV